MIRTQQMIEAACADARKPYADKIMELVAINADLLAALKLALPYIDRLAQRRDRTYLTMQATNDAATARAAIAKAEGKRSPDECQDLDCCPDCHGFGDSEDDGSPCPTCKGTGEPQAKAEGRQP